MATITLLNLRDRARQRANMEGDDQFIEDPEATAYINEAIADLWDMASENEGQSFLPWRGQLFTAPDVGLNFYNMPADFYKALRVELWATTSPTGWRWAMTPAMPNEIPALMSNAPYAAPWGDYRYRFSGGMGDSTHSVTELEVAPPIAPGQNLYVQYVLQAPVLVDDADVITVPNQWDEYIVVYAAISMLNKEDGDTDKLELRKAELAVRIRAMTVSLDRGRPERVQCVQDFGAINNGSYLGGGGWWGW